MMKSSKERSRPLVLVVDDDEMMRILAVESLVDSEFDVIEAHDGESGLAAFAQHHPDLVILDVMMPGMDGFEVCRSIRELPAGTRTPVLMATGLDDLEAIDRAYAVGATDFITKPLNAGLLRHRLLYIWRAHRNLVALDRSRQWLDKAQRIAKVGYVEWEQDSENFRVCEQAARIFGVSPVGGVVPNAKIVERLDEAQLESLRASISAAQGGECSFREELAFKVNGTQRFVSLQAEIHRVDGGVPCLIGAVQDITDRRRAENRLRELVSFDSVTGLPNRGFFLSKVAEIMAQQVREGSAAGMFSINVREFRRVNESLGAEAGDLVLRELGGRLAKMVQGLQSQGAGFGVVGRLGGDDFGVLLGPICTEGCVERALNAIQSTFAEPVRIYGREVYLDPRIGAAFAPQDTNDGEALLRYASVASNHQGGTGAGAYRFYNESMNTKAKARLKLEVALRQAVAKCGFELYYQPKVDAESEQVVGTEALIRWTDPELGRVNPAEFIPLAESNGLIIPLSEWVLRTACQEAAAWPSLMSVAVNVSARHFVVPGFVELVADTLATTGLLPARLQLEITEGILVSDTDLCRERLASLRALGVTIALDDFGTGYSSLSYLNHLPLDVLKIDRSFVMGLPGESDSIVRAILAMAKSLKLETVAEGVETKEQLEVLRQMGCEEIQGYFYSPPLPARDLFPWIERHNARRAKVPTLANLPVTEVPLLSRP